MNFRTDLALEMHEKNSNKNCIGVEVKKFSKDNIKVTEIKIKDKTGEETIGKPVGKYITIELTEFSHESEITDHRLIVISDSIKSLLPIECESILVVGLGNENITPDALGPLCSKQIFATRHLDKEMKIDIGSEKINYVSAISTGVLGQTGIETVEYIKGIVNIVKPQVVIVVDALASSSLSRLGKAIQITDTGITPGSGVGNSRAEISEKTLGIPVIAIGVPTVVDGVTMAYGLVKEPKSISKETESMIVTPKDIDLIIERAASLIALSINCAIQPELEPETFLALA